VHQCCNIELSLPVFIIVGLERGMVSGAADIPTDNRPIHLIEPGNGSQALPTQPTLSSSSSSLLLLFLLLLPVVVNIIRFSKY